MEGLIPIISLIIEALILILVICLMSKVNKLFKSGISAQEQGEPQPPDDDPVPEPE